MSDNEDIEREREQARLALAARWRTAHCAMSGSPVRLIKGTKRPKSEAPDGVV